MTSRPHERKRRQLDERTACHLHFVASDWGTAPARPVPVGMGRLGGYQCVGAVHERAVQLSVTSQKARYCLGMMWSGTASFIARSRTMPNASGAVMPSPSMAKRHHIGAYPAPMTKTSPLLHNNSSAPRRLRHRYVVA